MWVRGIVTAVVVTLGWSSHLEAQRPWLSLGVGGGVVLGSPLVEHDLVIITNDQERSFDQRIDLDDAGVVSANADFFVTRRIALRAQLSRGNGRVRAETRAATQTEDAGVARMERIGDVRINAIDAGITIWPWSPGTLGIAPFFTAGLGRFTYDFNATSNLDYFNARGTRSERSVQLGIGADLHVWRSVLLRFEAVNHRVNTPIQSGDFIVAGDGGGSSGYANTIHSVRLSLAAQVMIPFQSRLSPED